MSEIQWAMCMGLYGTACLIIGYALGVLEKEKGGSAVG